MVTHRLLDIIELKLREMSHTQLGYFVIGLGDAFAAHPGYQGPNAFPPPLPDPDELRQVGNNHLVVTKAAEGHDRYRIAERDALRPTTEMVPTTLIQWAVMRSVRENNASLIEGLGLQFKTTSTKSVAIAGATTPDGVKLKHGDETGEVYVSTNKVPKVRTYEVGFCLGDPSREESWSIVGPFDHCRMMKLTGLEPGKVYYFRVRCFVAGSMSPWSAIVSFRVL